MSTENPHMSFYIITIVISVLSPLSKTTPLHDLSPLQDRYSQSTLHDLQNGPRLIVNVPVKVSNMISYLMTVIMFAISLTIDNFSYSQIKYLYQQTMT